MHMPYNVVSTLLLLFQVLAPIGLFVWLAVERQPSWVHFLSQSVGVGGFCVFLFLTARWDWVGYWIRYGILICFVGAFVWASIRHGSRPLSQLARIDELLRLLLYVGVAILFLILSIQSVRGFWHRGVAVDLSFPLKDVDWYVGQGGSSPLLNIHHGVAAQAYALDIVALDRFGRRARGFLPRRLNDYLVNDQPVYAPCSGRLVAAADGYLDTTPPERDEKNIAGNFVAISCNDVTVFLAHLRQGSVIPSIGSMVANGERIARVGNSGNTTEPHLHIHAVQGREVELTRLLRDGEAVPIRFHGRFLVRNSRNRT
jgi:hypothetical protein